MSDTIRILLVDDHHIIRQGICALLDHESDFEVIGQAQDGRGAVQMVQDLSPDVIVMDLQMPALNGIDATRQAIAALPDVKVVCLSAHADRKMAEAAIKAGATAYVLKTAAYERLAEAIRSAVNNKIYLSPEVTGYMVNGFRDGQASEDHFKSISLSNREREVVQLMAEGFSTKQIATQLHISAKTVETHRRNVMQKLNMDSVAQLTKYAVREGITSL